MRVFECPRNSVTSVYESERRRNTSMCGSALAENSLKMNQFRGSLFSHARTHTHTHKRWCGWWWWWRCSCWRRRWRRRWRAVM